MLRTNCEVIENKRLVPMVKTNHAEFRTIIKVKYERKLLKKVIINK